MLVGIIIHRTLLELQCYIEAVNQVTDTRKFADLYPDYYYYYVS